MSGISLPEKRRIDRLSEVEPRDEGSELKKPRLDRENESFSLKPGAAATDRQVAMPITNTKGETAQADVRPVVPLPATEKKTPKGESK